MLNTRREEQNTGFYSYVACFVMTPPLTLTTAMQIAAAYGGDEL